jgi:hypothetical protein
MKTAFVLSGGEASTLSRWAGCGPLTPRAVDPDLPVGTFRSLRGHNASIGPGFDVMQGRSGRMSDTSIESRRAQAPRLQATGPGVAIDLAGGQGEADRRVALDAVPDHPAHQRFRRELP